MPLIEELPNETDIDNKENIKETAAEPNRIKIDSWDDVYSQCGVAPQKQPTAETIAKPAEVNSTVWSGPK